MTNLLKFERDTGGEMGTPKKWPLQRLIIDGKPLDVEAKPGGYLLGNHDYPVARYRAQHEELFKGLHNGDYPVAFDVGETGCGKTTNVPLAALETGLFDNKIYVGEGRIVQAYATRERLVMLLAEVYGEDAANQMVGFASATEKILHPENKIVVATYGYVTGELSHRTDEELQDSLVIVDEYHQREAEGDTILEVAKVRSVPSLVMSATINAEELAEHHCKHDGTPAPILRMEGRMYPTGELFMEDATKAALWCINEGRDVLYMLPRVADIQLEQSKIAGLAKRPHVIVPFHGEQSLRLQQRALEPKGDIPRVILATEMGGTSLTFDVDDVINPGIVRNITLQKGVEALALQRPSKAKSKQFDGRVGRVREGLVIHAPYSLMPKDLPPNPNDYDVPEMQRMRLDSLIIRLGTAGMRLGNMDELSGRIAKRLDYKDLPSPDEIERSLSRVRKLGGLAADNILTGTAYEMAKLNVDAQLARMIVASRLYSEDVHRYMVMAAAVAQHNGIVSRNQDSPGFKLSQERRADLLRDLDIYLHSLSMSMSEQESQGILPQRVDKISKLVDELFERENLNPATEMHLPAEREREELLRCMATGIEELFARKSAGKYRDPRDGRLSRTLLKESAVRPVARIAGTPWNLETISKSAKLKRLHFITRAMEVDVSQLPSIVPDRCTFEERDFEISPDGEILTHFEVIFDEQSTGYHVIKPIESMTEGLRDFAIRGLFQQELKHEELLPEKARKFRREVAELRELQHRSIDDLHVDYLLTEMQQEMSEHLPSDVTHLEELLSHVDSNHLRAFLNNKRRKEIRENSPTKLRFGENGSELSVKVRYDNHAALLYVPSFMALRAMPGHIPQLDGRNVMVQIGDDPKTLEYYTTWQKYQGSRSSRRKGTPRKRSTISY